MLRVAGSEPSSIVDGPGFRYTIFLQGCSHHCDGCQNPATWDKERGALKDTAAIIEDIKKAYYIDGVTISGGEPLDQAKELLKLLKSLKELNYHIIMFTGYTYEDVMQHEDMKKCMEYTDILIDGEYVKSKRSLSLRFRGSSNQRIIDIPASLPLENPVIIDLDNK